MQPQKSLLEYLKPYNVGMTKVRVGPSYIPPAGVDTHEGGDGGYVGFDELYKKSQALYTYGVGGDYRFEVDFNQKYNKPCYLYDHTWPYPERNLVPDSPIYFTREGLGINKEADCKDFLEHYAINKSTGDVFLKIDVENYEYEYFSKANIPQIAQITTGIALEVHDLVYPETQNKFVTIMERLSEHFVLGHIHGNNWGNTFNYTGYEQLRPTEYALPIVIELTFVNKRFVTTIMPDDRAYPIPGLDIPNCGNRPDCDLSFLNDL